MDIQQRIDLLNWEKVTEDMNYNGYASVPKVLTAKECDEFISQYNNETLYRKTINMERYRFGLGEYKYYQYPLPGLIQQLREGIYPKLAPIAITGCVC